MLRFSTFRLVPLCSLSGICSAFSSNRHEKTFQQKLKGSSGAVNKEYVVLDDFSKSDFVKLFKSKQHIQNCTLRVIGTGSNGIIPSFLISCMGQNYLFNCGESFGRLKGVFKEDTVLFFTQANWENMEGCLAFCKNFDFNLKYFGPSKCALFADIISKFGVTNMLKSDSSGYCGDQIRISVINLAVPSNSQHVVAYSCKVSDSPGKFNAEKAAELGVPSGPACRLLVEGRSIITKAGNAVHPSQVVGEPSKGPSFLVVDCPDKFFLEEVCSHHKLQPEWFKEEGEWVKLIVHITPLHILQNDQYCRWMANFGVGVDHLFLHSSVCPGEVSLRPAMSFSMPFHLMNPEVYHFPLIPNEKKISLKELNVIKYLKEDSLIVGQVDLKYHMLKSKVTVDFSETLEPLKNYLKTNYDSLRSFGGLYSQIKMYHRSISKGISWGKRDLVHHPISASLEHSNDCMVTFLGTSSSRSSAIRNVSGILLQTIDDGNLLFDCGTGTLQQLYRCYGKIKAHAILRNLRTIFISHMHADHCLGIFAILLAVKESRRISDPPVAIIGPNNFFSILHKWNHNSLFQKLDFSVIKSCNLVQDSYQQMKLNLRTVRVNHIDGSYAVILSRGNDWSIVYSGDTTPCYNLVKEGKDATLLIHEGTFSGRFIDRAKKFHHSTFSGVVDISKRMNAESTIVTHFSTRDPLHSLQLNCSAAGIIPAVDFMSVKISDLHKHKLDSVESRKVFNSIVRWIIQS